MSALTKGIYGCETNSKKTPFGLLNNQVRLDSVINSAGWFNKFGEKLGCGDLTMKDMAKIASLIPKGDAFIVLSEFDTGWSLPSHLDASSPGLDYVVQNCLWVINTGSILRVRSECNTESVEKDGVKYARISRSNFYKHIGYGFKKIEEPKKATPSREDLLKKAREILDAKGSNATGSLPKPKPIIPVPAVVSGKKLGPNGRPLKKKGATIGSGTTVPFTTRPKISFGAKPKAP